MVYASLTNPPVGEKKKKEYLELIAPHEVFLESVPSSVVLAMMFVVSEGNSSIQFIKKNGMDLPYMPSIHTPPCIHRFAIIPSYNS